MARRKRTPQVARPTPRQRLIELGKDLLILALTCSAVFLTLQNPIIAQMGLLSKPSAESTQPDPQREEQLVTPYAVAVRGDMGLYGASYDEVMVERAFGQLSPLFGEALTAAGSPEPITRRQWQALLNSPGAYCALQGTPSLAALQALLGEEERTSPLPGWAQGLLLAWDGDQVWLAWRQGETYYRARSTALYDQQLRPLLLQFSPNGAAFASTLAIEDEVYGALDPDVLIAMTPPQPQTYQAAAPDFVGDAAALEELLAALGFQSGVSSAYQTAGDKAINESGDRLRVSADGSVVFHAGGDSRYPVPTQGDRPTAGEAVQAAGELLSRALAPWQQEGETLLTGCEETEEGWRITFQTRLGGIPVRTGEEGWSAQFTVAGREISHFTLSVRSYTATGNTSLVPPERLAAAALESLPPSSGRLTLCYTDHAGATLSAGWMALE